MKIDNINLEIARHLRDGRKSYKNIAAELSIAENTVRKRVNNMVEAGILRFSGLVDPGKLPGHQVVFVGVKLNTMKSIPKSEELSKLRGVLSSSVVTGSYDLMLQVLLNEEFDMAEFYGNELDLVDDIQSAETYVAYKSSNMFVPYIL